ncbi:MAG: type II secretion system F family protein [Candidatus Nanoarchaeia archaeon]
MALVSNVERMLIAVEELKQLKDQALKNPSLKIRIDQQIKVVASKIENECSLIFNGVGDAGLKAVTPTIPVSIEKPQQVQVQKPVVQQIPIQPKTGPQIINQPLPKPVPIQKQELPVQPLAQSQQILSPQIDSKNFRRLSKAEKEKYMKDVKIKYEELEEFVKTEKSKKKEQGFKTPDFTLYKPNEIGAFANRMMKKSADKLIKKYPKVFEPMFSMFIKVDMPILSRSYVASLLFFSMLAFPAALLFVIPLNLAFQFSFVIVILIAFVIAILTPIGFYFYPSSLIHDRQKKIKHDLPFALVHMSAVAGSGAAPISIFELLVESEEYPELKKEIRKIMNYVNLFGYNLSNALRNVAATTPSEELKELLNGMISTIETGGDLKGYLKEKADGALDDYKLERKREVDALATFSEVYTSILIAAPLLMIVTLSIINSIGGSIAGISVRTLAILGVGIALPLLNVGFMGFLKTQSSA